MSGCDLSDMRLMNDCGVISQIEISQVINEGFSISFIKNNGEKVNLNTQRGNTRIFKTLDSAFNTAKEFTSNDCKLIVVSREN
ncbi:TPA: hypothetical protein U5E00_004552 [Yersinia enterocolitica]|jgi:hypothetical protein|uniref:hypothetical protein n=1 Tax=Enterobacterales TaxID=91347 RepID=UPI001F1F2A05|nr:hypothetical protein [Hafnia paralvei]EKN5164306.1 hypothetical protein [Yersinia enterocolitica]EKN6076370.1 hypothetical protein [Yersinia enterocolitica]ELI7929466.1 hypothetical protein [Yersinia enterocolitica]ELI7961662.1 hypothetical protein [Yersinia enterocolitica]ELI8143067.1 hypothetical protein [Yersinia enterocolitica]